MNKALFWDFDGLHVACARGHVCPPGLADETAARVRELVLDGDNYKLYEDAITSYPM